MKRILIVLFCLISTISSAQIYQNRPEYGWLFNRIKVSNTLTIPQDTLLRSNNTDAGAIVYNMGDSSIYAWNGSWWIKQGRSLGNLKAMDSLRYDPSTGIFYGRYTTGGEFPAATGLVDSLKHRVDSVSRSNDTLYFWRLLGNIPIKITGIPIANITGLSDSLLNKPTLSAADARFVPQLRTISLTGTSPITITGGTQSLAANRTWTFSHATSGVTSGTYGSASVIPIITVNNTGHITSVTAGVPDLQSITNNGSNTSNEIIIARDSSGLRLQQASPTGPKNNYIRWSTYLNGRELATLGFRESYTLDSSFNFYNRAGAFNFWSSTNNANDIKLNNFTLWNSGNVSAGTGISITGTGPYIISSTYTVPTLQQVMGVNNQSNIIYNSIVPTGESFRFNNGGWGSMGSTFSAQETYLGMNAYVKGSDVANQIRYIYGTFGYAYIKLNASTGSLRVFGSTTSSTADAVISSPVELINISPSGTLASGTSTSTGNAFKIQNSASTSLFEVANNNTVVMKGAVIYNITTQTTNYTVLSTDYTLLTSTSGITYTLGAPVAGRMLYFKNRSAGNISVALSGATIDGSSSTVTIAAGGYLQLQGGATTDWIKLNP